MQDKSTNVRVTEIDGPNSQPILVLRFSGDITSSSKAVVLGAYHGLPPNATRILLDFSKVEYLNSSGIAIIIQMLMEAAFSRSGGWIASKRSIFGSLLPMSRYLPSSSSALPRRRYRECPRNWTTSAPYWRAGWCFV